MHYWDLRKNTRRFYNSYMRSRKYIILAVALYAAMFATVSVFAWQGEGKQKKFSLPKDAREIAPNVFYLGTKPDVDGTLVEGYAFIHKKDSAAKGGNARKSGGSTCYAFLASGARWKNTESYLVNTANNAGLASTFVMNVVSQSISEWEKYVSFDIFGPGTETTEALSAEASSPDGLNEVLFAQIDNAGVIAVTTTWGVFGGAPQNRRLVEWDMVFDDVDFIWGDAALDLSVMDFQNIATHELGHAAGMGHPSDSCIEETMYRFATEGETKKRDLNSGDIQGIQKLYQ